MRTLGFGTRLCKPNNYINQISINIIKYILFYSVHYICIHTCGPYAHLRVEGGQPWSTSFHQTFPGPALSFALRKRVSVYSKHFSPSPNPQAEEQNPSPTVRDCLFNIFATTLHIWWQTEKTPSRGEMAPPNMHRNPHAFHDNPVVATGCSLCVVPIFEQQKFHPTRP